MTNLWADSKVFISQNISVIIISLLEVTNDLKKIKYTKTAGHDKIGYSTGLFKVFDSALTVYIQ